jgi:C4-dicarboxylate-specific signal transduction histidine kinase
MTKPNTAAQYDALGSAGLRFFGQVSASIAHEVKNVLAIINENAGLLEDLTFAARRGTAIDPERLNKACRQFSKQIERADGIMKNMSSFAHSIDSFSADINLHEVANLVANLAGRKAAMRKLIIEVEAPKAPVIFPGNPFLLQNLIWLCLEFAIGATDAGATLRLIAGKEENRISLRIGGISGLDGDLTARMPAGHEDLLTALGAELSIDRGTHELVVHLG